MNILLIYLLAANIVTFVVFGIDKYKAKRGLWRIPEASLLTMAVIGAWLGTKVWHHKTLHKKFKYGIPLIIALQAALAVYLLTP
ncbi:MAG: DUF1294 domain-containing protein [Muribaculaceae bacterium]